MKRLLLALVVAAGLVGSADAEVCTRNNNGWWSTTSFWSGCTPDALDQYNVGSFSVMLDKGAACSNGSAICATASATTAAVNVGANGSLILGDGTTVVRIDCPAGSVDPCITNSGTIQVGPGQTVKVQPDVVGWTTANPDGINTLSGGRLVLRGSTLTDGTITSVTTDEATVTDPDLGFGLTTRDFTFCDARAHFSMKTDNTGEWAGGDSCVDNCYAIRFTSGDRKGRWYNIESHTSNCLTVDHDSRGNPAQNATSDASFGAKYTTGTACFTTTDDGTCDDSGAFVSGTTTSWTRPITTGSRFYCNVDGPGTSVRIKRHIDADSIELERSVTATAGNCDSLGRDAYAILDDNQPWPFEDHSEHIAPGDTYEVIRPATWQGATSTGGEPTGSVATEQTFLNFKAGAFGDFQNAVVKWAGRNSTHDADVGVSFEDLTTGGARLLNNEFFKLGGVGLVYFRDPTTATLTFQGNFLHQAHPLCTAAACHGLIVGDTLVVGAENPRVVSTATPITGNRIESTGDDTVWWYQPSKDVVISGNVFKYFPNNTVGDTTTCVDTAGQLTGNIAQTRLHDNMLVIDNICANNGGVAPSEGFKWAIDAGNPSTQAFVRNVVINIQAGPAINHSFDGVPSAADFTNSTCAFVGNYVGSVSDDAVLACHVVIGNVIRRWGLNRVQQLSAIAQATRRVQGNVIIPHSETIVSGGQNLVYALAERSAGTFSGLGDVVFDAAPEISDNVFFFHGVGVRLGDNNQATDLEGSPDFNFHHNLVDCGRNSPDSFENGDGLLMDTTAGHLLTVTNNVFANCYADDGGTGRCATKGPNAALSLERDNMFYGCETDASGFTKNASDVSGPAPEWHPLSLNFDRQISGATTHGPRAVGVSFRPLAPNAVPRLAGTTAANARDTDRDGVMDLYDNCPRNFNPAQRDADNDGKGCECDSNEACS